MKYIGGLNIDHAISRVKQSIFLPIFDYALESATCPKQTWHYMNIIWQDVKKVQPQSAWALKYSSFHDFQYMHDTVEHLTKHVNTIVLDSEHHHLYKKEQQTYNDLIDIYNRNEVRLYKTYQMYRKDSLKTLVDDIHNFEHLGIKLVRGAYHDYKVDCFWPYKHETDDNYNNALRYLSLKMKKNHNLRVMIATHNNDSLEYAAQLNFDKTNTTFAQLLDMNDEAGIKLNAMGYRVYKYVPYGTLMETFPYLLRRFYESKSNFS